VIVERKGVIKKMPGQESSLKSYRDLRVWQDSLDITKKIYLLTKSFPRSEQYGLTSQMRRAAVSIPSNIAEGHARIGTGEYLRFLSIALGSIAELETQLIISQRLDYLSAQDLSSVMEQLARVGKMLRNLYKSIEPYRVHEPVQYE